MMIEHSMFCPKCKSRLYPGDRGYIEASGVCSYYVLYDTTPGKRFKKAFDASQQKKGKKRNDKPRATYKSHGIQTILFA